MNKRLIITLIVSDLVWSISAFIYDYSAIVRTPVYFWPFLIVCPLFPFLLALVWVRIYKNTTPNDFLLAFAAIPSAIYLIAALIYYPTWMIQNSFDWLSFGQIFWVAFYGIQGIYLLLKFAFTKMALWLAGSFLLLSLTVQYQTRTLGFQDFANFSDNLLLTEYTALEIIVLGLIISLTITKKLALNR